MNNSFTLVTLYMVSFIGYAGFSLLFPVMPLYATELGSPISQVGLIVAVYSYVTALTLIPSGMLSDKLGRRALLITGLIIFTMAPLLYPLATNPQQLMLVRAIHGLASAIFIPAANALVVDLAPASKRGEVLGRYTASTQLGLMAGPVIGGAFLNYFNFETAFYSCSVISLLGLIIFLARFGAIPHKPAAESIEGSSWRWLGQRAIFAGLLAPFILTIGSGTIATYIPLYGKDFGLTEFGAGLVITTLYASSALLRAPAGRLSDKIGRKPVILFGVTLSAIAVALIPLFHGLYQLIVISAFFGTGMGIAMPASLALIADLSRSETRGLAMGMASCFLHAGLAVGATAMGIIAEMQNFDVMFWACALSLAFGLFIILGLMQRHR